MSPIVARFRKAMFNVCVRVGHSPNKLQPDTRLLETGVGLNIFNSTYIQDDWKNKVKNHPTPELRCVIKEPITLLRTNLLFV